MIGIDLPLTKCVISCGKNTININGEEISTLILNSLPDETKNFKDYPGEIMIYLEINNKPLPIKTLGFVKFNNPVGNKEADIDEWDG
jgi:hypothetical protein